MFFLEYVDNDIHPLGIDLYLGEFENLSDAVKYAKSATKDFYYLGLRGFSRRSAPKIPVRVDVGHYVPGSADIDYVGYCELGVFYEY